MKPALWIILPFVAALAGFTLGRSSNSLPAPVVVSAKATPEKVAASPAAAPGNSATFAGSPMEALDFPSALHRQVAFSQALGKAGAEQFTAVFQRLLAEPERDQQLFNTLLMLWVERFPEEAARAATSMPAGRVGFARIAMLRVWWRRDPEAADAWAQKVLPPDQIAYWNKVRQQLASESVPVPDRPLAEILRLGNQRQRSRELREHFKKRVETDPQGASREALAMSDNDRNEVFSWLLNNWAGRDPLAVLRWTGTPDAKVLAESRTSDYGLEEIFKKQLQANLSATRQIVEGWPDGWRRDEYLVEIAAAMMAQDKNAAIAYFEAQRARKPDLHSGPFIKAWMAVDPAGALNALRAEVDRMLPDSNAEIVAGRVTYALGEMMDRDPAQAGSIIAAMPKSLLPHAFFALAEKWCVANGSEALAWAIAQPAGAPRDDALREFTYIWAQHETKKTTEMLESLPPDSGRWAATAGFAYAIMDTDPDAALQWLRTIRPEGQHHDVLRRVWRKWARKNYQSAADWKEHAQLTAAEAAAIEAQE